MTPVAGANWGGHLVPRPGQEVLVAFQNGNIDRPIIVGTAYNGSGSTDAQGNRIGSGTMQASANAPAFFAGKEAEAHTHNASLSGLKSQPLNTSRSGQGGYNQLVFDDTPGESRIELGTTEYQSALQLGPSNNKPTTPAKPTAAMVANWPPKPASPYAPATACS